MISYKVSQFFSLRYWSIHNTEHIFSIVIFLGKMFTMMITRCLPLYLIPKLLEFLSMVKIFLIEKGFDPESTRLKVDRTNYKNIYVLLLFLDYSFEGLASIFSLIFRNIIFIFLLNIKPHPG